MQRDPIRYGWTALATALLATGCATQDGAGGDGASGTVVRAMGTIVAIDTQPWTYDGHAIVQVDTASRGRLDVQLPARWNLCQAQAVDVEALKVGMEVELVGAAEEEGNAVTVCADPSHRLAPATR